MLRLRTTTTLSALALGIGIAGTAGLSTLTSGWQWQGLRVVAATQPRSSHARTRESARHQPSVSGVVRHRRALSAPADADVGDAQAAIVERPVELIPLTTPTDTSRPWYQLQGHLDGHVVMHLTVDGNGRVLTAALRQSSGDPVLDDHALRSVHLWRFAIPSDHPDGLSGDLPMRFASRS